MGATNKLTYRELAINRLISIGISNRFEAEEIVNAIENVYEYAPQVFRDFKGNANDDWDSVAEFVERDV